MKSEIIAILLGFSIFIVYNFGGMFFQTSVLYIDGSILKFIFSCIVGLLFVKVFKLVLRRKIILLASLTVYFAQIIVRILMNVASNTGDSIAKMIVKGIVVELITFGIVLIALVLLSFMIVQKKDL